MNTLIEPTPGAGHNLPDNFDLMRETIDDLFDEAGNWLDGEEIDNEKSAEAIGTLLTMLRTAGKDAKGMHDTEKAPHREAGIAVDDRYRPLTDRVKLATDTCKKVLAPWLAKKQAAQEEVARQAREVAEKKQREAQEARAAADATDLAAREAAEKLIQEAKRADQKATRAEKQKPNTKAGSGKAVSLRTTYRPVLNDPVKAARHFWERERAEMETFLLTLAERHTRNGQRTIPGFEIIEEKSAV